MKLRLPHRRREGGFRLFVAGVEGGPPDRWFRSLDAALRAAAGLDEPWRSHAWVIEYADQPSFGGIPVVRDVVHLRDGVRVTAAER